MLKAETAVIYSDCSYPRTTYTFGSVCVCVCLVGMGCVYVSQQLSPREYSCCRGNDE